MPFSRLFGSCTCGRSANASPPIIAGSVEIDYELLDTLGEGKTCRVMRARSKRTTNENIVAVKMIQTTYLNTPSRVEALSNELRVLLLLRSQSQVVSLIDVYQDETMVSIVTTYVPGGELMPALSVHKVLNEHIIRRLVRELVEVLAYMHKKGICHRDLKPENMLIDAHGQLKLIDFGIAHIQTKKGLPSMTGLCGTGPFMAPEVFQKDVPYTSKVDIWALGVCVFVFLTGHVPFESKFMSQLEDKICSGEYLIPKHQQLSATARSFIASCLNVDVSLRPSAKSLLKHPWLDLRHIQNVFSTPFTDDHINCLKAYTSKTSCSHQAKLNENII